MKLQQRTRKCSPSGKGLRFARVYLSLLASALASPVFGQVSSYGDKTAGENSSNELPRVLQAVAVAQHLNAQLPLTAAFADDTGAAVTLGKYFDGRHPALLSLVYYNCPMLCSEELDGLTSALQMVRLVPGKDFEIVVMSIDPAETPALAAQKKAFYVKRYGHPETANGWHFLVGPKTYRCRHPGGWFRLRACTRT